MMMRKVVVIGVFTLVILLGLVFAYAKIDYDKEHGFELTDLQTMRGAEATALVLWKDRKPEVPVEYWYSAVTLELIEASNPKPIPYGLGKSKVGNGLKEFQQEYGKNYDYQEDADYTGKIIHLVVDTDSIGELRVVMNWV